MMDWRTCSSTFLSQNSTEDFAIVGHEHYTCVWAAKPGGLLASITPQEVGIIVGEDRSTFLQTGLTIAGKKCCVIRDNLFAPDEHLLDLITKGNDKRPICIGMTPEVLVVLMASAGVHGGILNKTVYDILRGLQ
ncbi:profilin-3 [Hyperolius riggenbachi]|uniref:profilin-3 n=1 Tax=Hyperolius riggenbachi TaxID=752182 RepID=UPI0035A2F0DF